MWVAWLHSERSLGHVDPLTADGRLALDGSNTVARQQAGPPLNKTASLGLSSQAQNGQ